MPRINWVSFFIGVVFAMFIWPFLSGLLAGRRAA